MLISHQRATETQPAYYYAEFNVKSEISDEAFGMIGRFGQVIYNLLAPGDQFFWDRRDDFFYQAMIRIEFQQPPDLHPAARSATIVFSEGTREPGVRVNRFVYDVFSGVVRDELDEHNKNWRDLPPFRNHATLQRFLQMRDDLIRWVYAHALARYQIDVGRRELEARKTARLQRGLSTCALDYYVRLMHRHHDPRLRGLINYMFGVAIEAKPAEADAKVVAVADAETKVVEEEAREAKRRRVDKGKGVAEGERARVPSKDRCVNRYEERSTDDHLPPPTTSTVTPAPPPVERTPPRARKTPPGVHNAPPRVHKTTPRANKTPSPLKRRRDADEEETTPSKRRRHDEPVPEVPPPATSPLKRKREDDVPEISTSTSPPSDAPAPRTPRDDENPEAPSTPTKQTITAITPCGALGKHKHARDEETMEYVASPTLERHVTEASSSAEVMPIHDFDMEFVGEYLSEVGDCQDVEPSVKGLPHCLCPFCHQNLVRCSDPFRMCPLVSCPTMGCAGQGDDQLWSCADHGHSRGFTCRGCREQIEKKNCLGVKNSKSGMPGTTYIHGMKTIDRYMPHAKCPDCGVVKCLTDFRWCWGQPLDSWRTPRPLYEMELSMAEGNSRCFTHPPRNAPCDTCLEKPENAAWHTCVRQNINCVLEPKDKDGNPLTDEDGNLVPPVHGQNDETPSHPYLAKGPPCVTVRGRINCPDCSEGGCGCTEHRSRWFCGICAGKGGAVETCPTCSEKFCAGDLRSCGKCQSYDRCNLCAQIGVKELFHLSTRDACLGTCYRRLCDTCCDVELKNCPNCGTRTCEQCRKMVCNHCNMPHCVRCFDDSKEPCKGCVELNSAQERYEEQERNRQEEKRKMEEASQLSMAADWMAKGYEVTLVDTYDDDVYDDDDAGSLSGLGSGSTDDVSGDSDGAIVLFDDGWEPYDCDGDGNPCAPGTGVSPARRAPSPWNVPVPMPAQPVASSSKSAGSDSKAVMKMTVYVPRGKRPPPPPPPAAKEEPASAPPPMTEEQLATEEIVLQGTMDALGPKATRAQARDALAVIEATKRNEELLLALEPAPEPATEPETEPATNPPPAAAPAEKKEEEDAPETPEEAAARVKKREGKRPMWSTSRRQWW